MGLPLLPWLFEPLLRRYGLHQSPCLGGRDGDMAALGGAPSDRTEYSDWFSHAFGRYVVNTTSSADFCHPRLEEFQRFFVFTESLRAKIFASLWETNPKSH